MSERSTPTGLEKRHTVEKVASPVQRMHEHLEEIRVAVMELESGDLLVELLSKVAMLGVALDAYEAAIAEPVEPGQVDMFKANVEADIEESAKGMKR